MSALAIVQNFSFFFFFQWSEAHSSIRREVILLLLICTLPDGGTGWRRKLLSNTDKIRWSGTFLGRVREASLVALNFVRRVKSEKSLVGVCWHLSPGCSDSDKVKPPQWTHCSFEEEANWSSSRANSTGKDTMVIQLPVFTFFEAVGLTPANKDRSPKLMAKPHFQFKSCTSWGAVIDLKPLIMQGNADLHWNATFVG